MICKIVNRDENIHTAEHYLKKKKKKKKKNANQTLNTFYFQSDMKCNKSLMDYLQTGNAPFIFRFSKSGVIGIMEYQST
jgi:hypothetical protein